MKKGTIKKTKVFTLALCTMAVAIGGVVIAQNPNDENKTEVGSCTVSDSDIIDYLEGFGYTNIVLSNGPNCNKLADTDYSYNTKVFVSQTQIIGHEDLPEK